MNRCECGDSECRSCGTAQGTISATDDGHKHWPPHIVELMQGRNVLTVALDLVGGVRGANDLCLSECANAMTVLEWYLKKWEPTDCAFDKAAHDCITTAHALAEQWFQREASDMGI